MRFLRRRYKSQYPSYEGIQLVQSGHHFPFYLEDLETIYFDIILENTQEKVGMIDLRIGMNDYYYYLGQVGYNILEKYRGHHYSYKACRVLFEIVKAQYKMKELWITCSPENIASYKTLVKLKGELMETVRVPKTHELYYRNERVKCIFKYDLME
ncbi:MAG: GNAT family N-acetyltransferase [Erysipelotrichaceae bacterium]